MEPTIDTNFASATSILSLSKDAILDQNGGFRDPPRFTDPAGSTGDKLSVTTFGRSASESERHRGDYGPRQNATEEV